MRPAPALQVVVARFGVWRAGVWSVGLTSAAAGFGWAAWHGWTEGPVPAAPSLAVGVLAGLGSVWAAAHLARVRAYSLHWDGWAWQLGLPAAPALDPIQGELQVAIDAGSWLLLRFDATWPPGLRHRRWLPLQRRGLEAAWHGLRCALHSPRPGPSTPRPIEPRQAG